MENNSTVHHHHHQQQRQSVHLLPFHVQSQNHLDKTLKHHHLELRALIPQNSHQYECLTAKYVLLEIKFSKVKEEDKKRRVVHYLAI